MFRARWDPGWYNLDQCLRVGEQARFAFFPRENGGERVFVNCPGTEWEYRDATVLDIRHAGFGRVVEVDTSSFGEYTFQFAGGWWVRVEAEQDPGALNASSADPPFTDLAHPTSWALSVTLA